MKGSIKLVTLLVNFLLAIVGSIAAYITGWITLVPIVFAIGIPLVNLEKPPLKKVGLISFISFINLIIFLLEVFILLNLPYDKYVFPTIAEGFAGVFVLLINGLFIKKIKISWQTSILTFLLSALAIPLSLGLIETFIEGSKLPKDVVDYFKQFGGMLFWMIFTTLGVVYAMQSTSENKHQD